MAREVNLAIDDIEILLDLLSDKIKQVHYNYKHRFEAIRCKLRPLYEEEIDIRLCILGIDGIDYDEHYS